MSARGGGRSARGSARRLFLGLARGLAIVWLVPALLFNVEWGEHADWHANFAAVMLILGSALFIEGALRFRSLVLTPVCVIAALFLVFVNTKQATRTLSFASEAASEARQAEITLASHLASQRSQLLERRQVQEQLAGEMPVGVLEAELMQLKAREARRWRTSHGCDPARVTSSAVFCAEVAAAEGRIEAARQRDRIDRDLAALPAPTMAMDAGGPPEAVSDVYAANVVALLTEAGFKPTERLVRAEEAMSRALGLELLAALGPTCWLAFVNVLFGIGGHASADSDRARRVPIKRCRADAEPAKVAAPKATADDIERWIADDLEEAPASAMRSAEIRKLAHAWFDARHLPKPNEQDLWARVRQHFVHDPNNGRPRYLNVRAKKAAPALRLVSN